MTLKQIEKKITFISDETGKKTTIVLPPAIYEELIETLEDCIDIRDIIKLADEPAIAYTYKEMMAMLNEKTDA